MRLCRRHTGSTLLRGYLIGKYLSRSKFAESPVRRAGLRTHMLVALGSCLYSEASWSMYSVPGVGGCHQEFILLLSSRSSTILLSLFTRLFFI